MKKNHPMILPGIAVLVITVLACEAGDLVAMVRTAATPTRTPRPTFTPRPSLTPTPEDTATPEPTVTLSPTPTRRVVLRTATPKPPTPVPPPQFPVTFVEGYLCPQPNDPIWKITGRVNRADSSFFLPGYVLGVFAPDGRFLKSSPPSAEDEYATITIGGNCRAEKLYRSNIDLDVSEFRMQAPLTVRIIKSATDRTALSVDFKATFEQPGNYYLQYHVP